MIDFMFRSLTQKDFESMARTAEFLDDENRPLPGINVDSDIPIVEVPSPDTITPPVMKTGYHCNVRVSGEREQEEIEGLEQTDASGNPLPAAARTHFGLAFGDNGTVWADGATEGLSYVNVVLLNEQTIASPQRVWQ